MSIVMAVAAREPERDLSDMMGALVIANEKGGKHKKGSVDSQHSLNSKGRPMGADAFNRLRDRLKDRVEQKHKEEQQIKKDTLRIAANTYGTQIPRRSMNHPPHGSVIAPPAFVALPPARFVAPVQHPAPENFEAEVDARQPLLPLLQEDKHPEAEKLLVKRIIERQMLEAKSGTSPYNQGASSTICDFGSQNASIVSSGSLDGEPDIFSPQQSSTSSPASINIYNAHQLLSGSSCDFVPVNYEYVNGFDPSSN